jgi:hypothetical protein
MRPCDSSQCLCHLQEEKRLTRLLRVVNPRFDPATLRPQVRSADPWAAVSVQAAC